MHALAFRVCRLCRPDIPAEQVIGLGVRQDFLPDHLTLCSGSDSQESSGPFESRTNIDDPVQAFGLNGVLELPQSFGTIHLGEAFTSYISVGNYSNATVEDVVIKAELQSTRQKVTLYETATPLPHLAPGERHEFIIKHDIKEISSYTLICSTSYTDKGETAYQPQYFKFVAQNPLSVRTKIRSLTRQTFLEACVENFTSKPLVLAYVRLDAAPNIAVVPASSAWSEGNPSDDPQSSLPEQYPDSLEVVDAGGSKNFLYALHPDQSTALSAEGGGILLSGSLGKLEIRWRGNLGQLGRLQTQQIMANAANAKDVELLVMSLPQVVHLESPFMATLLVKSNVDSVVEALALRISEQPGTNGLAVEDMSAAFVSRLDGYGSSTVSITLLPLQEGLQKVQAIELVSQADDRVLDMVSVECFVNR
ncbi:Trafficking protein particle complex subunit 13 [Coccomyxa sp. Obi]|nr:Trafficking protein particle complex subunit 13 [Coccomyxa sp. Obi]